MNAEPWRAQVRQVLPVPLFGCTAMIVAKISSYWPTKGKGGCGCGPQGGSISAESQHPAHKKVNYGLENITNSVGKNLHTFLIFAEWLEHDVLKKNVSF